MHLPQPWNALLSEKSLLVEVLHTVYRTEAKVDTLHERVNRIEDREHSRGTTVQPVPSPKAWSPRDYILTIAGGALVTAAWFDKVPWSSVQSLVSALK